MYDRWDHDDTYREMLAGRVSGVSVTVPTLTDPSLARDGRHLITMMALLPFDAVRSWLDSKPAYQTAMLDSLERLLPGVGDRLILAEGGDTAHDGALHAEPARGHLRLGADT